MKKILSFISLCLTAAMILPVCAFAADGDAALPFRDVGAGEWYYGNVKYVYENGIMKGTSDTEFSPDGTLTRAMCVTILHRAAGEPEPEAESSFTDVSDTEYYSKAVSWAQDMRIVNGKTSTLFSPDDAITRAEFSAMMYRYLYYADLDLKESNSSVPSDSSAIPSYAKEAVTVMYRSGVLNGKERGRFDPDAPITRAEAAAIIERFNNTAIPFVREDDGVLDVAFFGDSFTYVPRMYDHLETLAEGKHAIQTYNYTQGGWTVYDHYTLWKTKAKMPSVRKEIRKWDVVILNETGAAEYTLLKDDFFKMYESILEYDPNYPKTFEEYYEYEISVNKNAAENYKLLVDLFGRDKQFFNLCKSAMVKTEEGMELSEDGLSKRVGNSWRPSNKAGFMWRDWLKQNCNINRIMLNLDSFDPDNPLNPRDFDYLPDDYHPNLMFGYCHALALYCTIYDEPCIEQNNGILTDDDIPGDTPEEKEAYMIMIKNMVQEQLDFQNSH